MHSLNKNPESPLTAAAGVFLGVGPSLCLSTHSLLGAGSPEEDKSHASSHQLPVSPNQGVGLMSPSPFSTH